MDEAQRQEIESEDGIVVPKTWFALIARPRWKKAPPHRFFASQKQVVICQF
jgi:hypothetical protein